MLCSSKHLARLRPGSGIVRAKQGPQPSAEAGDQPVLVLVLLCCLLADLLAQSVRGGGGLGGAILQGKQAAARGRGQCGEPLPFPP